MAGIKVAPLPWSSDELPDDLPFLSSRAPDDYLGRTIIYVDTEATPPLFRPEPDGVRYQARASSRSIADIDAAYMALALESDDFADVAFKWNEYSELREVFSFRNSSTWTWSGSQFAKPVAFRLEHDYKFPNRRRNTFARETIRYLIWTKQSWEIPSGH